VTLEEIERELARVHAEMSATQTLLLSLIIKARKHGIGTEVIKEAFDFAADNYIAASYSSDEVLKTKAAGILKVLDSLRETTIGQD
jgi:hypothetical protein